MSQFQWRASTHLVLSAGYGTIKPVSRRIPVFRRARLGERCFPHDREPAILAVSTSHREFAEDLEGGGDRSLKLVQATLQSRCAVPRSAGNQWPVPLRAAW